MSVFSPSGSAPLSTVNIEGSAVGTVLNVAIASANTEVSATLPFGTHKFLLKLRTPATLKLAYSAGTSGSTYITIPPHNFYTESELTIGVSGLTLYFQADSAPLVAELVYWT